MYPLKIQEAKNGAAQLSEGNMFLMVNKFRIKKGANIGQSLIVVRMSQLSSEKDHPDVGVFTEIKSFLLSKKEFETWIALLIQVSDRQLTDLKDGEKSEGQETL